MFHNEIHAVRISRYRSRISDKVRVATSEGVATLLFIQHKECYTVIEVFAKARRIFDDKYGFKDCQQFGYSKSFCYNNNYSIFGTGDCRSHYWRRNHWLCHRQHFRYHSINIEQRKQQASNSVIDSPNDTNWIIFVIEYSVFVFQIEALWMNEGGFQNEYKGVFFKKHYTRNGVRTL